MNIVTIIGRLTRDPEVRETADGLSICRFTIAVDRPKKKDGTKEADFPGCVAFGHTAETIGQYMTKGSRIAITGHINTGKYTRDDGTTVYTTDIAVDRFDFIDKRNDTQQHQQTTQEDFPF